MAFLHSRRTKELPQMHCCLKNQVSINENGRSPEQVVTLGKLQKDISIFRVKTLLLLLYSSVINICPISGREEGLWEELVSISHEKSYPKQEGRDQHRCIQPSICMCQLLKHNHILIHFLACWLAKTNGDPQQVSLGQIAPGKIYSKTCLVSLATWSECRLLKTGR